MNKNTLTIGVYGIQDINNSQIPTISHDHSIAILKNGKILHNKIVKNTKILQLEDSEKCQPEDISDLVVL